MTDKAVMPLRAAAQIDVSVIVPTYRRERQVVEAIHSALSQTGPSVEVLVLDDDPQGSAGTAVRAIDDPRVKYLLCPKHSGGRPAVVRNEGAKLARGRFLHFLDDDDLLKPGALALLSEHLDARPKVGMAFGEIIPFGNCETDLHRNQVHFQQAAYLMRKTRTSRALVANLLFCPALLINSACMARREAFATAGGYDTTLPICEDTDFWARVARVSGHVYVDQPVVEYRTGEASLMHALAKNDSKLRAAYSQMHANYKQQHGLIEFYALKIWARTTLRQVGRDS